MILYLYIQLQILRSAQNDESLGDRGSKPAMRDMDTWNGFVFDAESLIGHFLLSCCNYPFHYAHNLLYLNTLQLKRLFIRYTDRFSYLAPWKFFYTLKLCSMIICTILLDCSKTITTFAERNVAPWERATNIECCFLVALLFFQDRAMCLFLSLQWILLQNQNICSIFAL